MAVLYQNIPVVPTLLLHCYHIIFINVKYNVLLYKTQFYNKKKMTKEKNFVPSCFEASWRALIKKKKKKGLQIRLQNIHLKLKILQLRQLSLKKFGMTIKENISHRQFIKLLHKHQTIQRKTHVRNKKLTSSGIWTPPLLIRNALMFPLHFNTFDTTNTNI